MADPDISAEGVVAVLRRHRFHFDNEAQLQDGIATVLDTSSVPYEREALVGYDRIDFLVRRDFLSSGVGVEVKVDGSLTNVTRQLHRYAVSSRVEALLLVTTRGQHHRVARTMNGKPVNVYVLPRSYA